MERALNLEALADAIGVHRGLPTAQELQRLIADLEVALFIRQPEVPPQVINAAWYLHGVASSDAEHRVYAPTRQRRAFAVSAHIFDVALASPEGDRSEKLDLAFAAAIGYMRGGLEPNSIAIYRRSRDLVLPGTTVVEHMGTIAVEAGLALVGLQTRELFGLFRQWRAGLSSLAEQVRLSNLSGTSFGTAEAVVLGADDLLRYLAFGDLARLDQARNRLLSAVRGEAGPEDVNGRWVASHLLSICDEASSGSVWAVLPPSIPSVAKQAFCLASPPVLTLWEPQRQLLTGDPSALAETTRRVVVSVPTSAGKTLIGQLLMVSHLAASNSSVCYVAPTRSLCREVRRAMGARLRLLQKEVGIEQPDFGLTGAFANLNANASLADLVGLVARLAESDAPDVEVMTPERLAHLLRRDPTDALARFGMFVFDEAQLIGESGRGFTAETLLSFLHWRTRDTRHRIVLLSAAMGNAAHIMSWLGVGDPGRLQTSEWRGPRRLHAIFTTAIDWDTESRTATRSKQFPQRLTYALKGEIRLRVAEDAAARRLVIREPVGTVAFKASSAGQRGPRDASRSTRNYQAVARMIVALGHAGAVLVVTSTRDAARRMAEELATLVPERRDMAAVVDFVRLRLSEAHPLVATLRHGVAFHHAALPTDVLEILEESLREDRLNYLTCTSTLTEGVNLPVRTVVISETRYEGQPSDAQISGARLINALGRAGRAGKETEGWLVLVHPDRAQESDFQLLTPSASDLDVRSQLTTDAAVLQLAAFEELLRASEDAVFRVAGRIGEFIAFVWFVLTSEEELGKAAEAADVEGALQATLAFHQLDKDLQDRWLAVANSVRLAYAASDAHRRRAWARSGTTVGSARELDEMADATLAAIKGRDFALSGGSETVLGALRVMDSVGALDRLLELPERPAEWRFRVTRSGQSASIPVSISALLQGWLTGENLSSLADRFLGQVSEPAWRIEQLVDAITSHFEHFLAWTVSILVELVNERLESDGFEARLCPQLGAYIRYGVNTIEALSLMLAGLRSRRLAHSVARAALSRQEHVDSLRDWLGAMSVPQWRDNFDATPAEILDLLDLTRPRRRSALRTLLETGLATVRVSITQEGSDAIRAAVEETSRPDESSGGRVEGSDLAVVVAEVTADPIPRRLAVFDRMDTLLAVIPTSSHGDVQTILDTGLAIATTLNASIEAPDLRVRLTEIEPLQPATQ